MQVMSNVSYVPKPRKIMVSSRIRGRVVQISAYYKQFLNSDVKRMSFVKILCTRGVLC